MRDMIEHRIMDLKLQNVKLSDVIIETYYDSERQEYKKQKYKNEGALEELKRMLGYIPYDPAVGMSIQSAVTNTKPKIEKVYI